MILFENSVLRLDYDPATDIVVIAYPDLHEYLLPEIKHNIDVLVEHVINYNIPRVLLDSSRTISTVSPEKGQEIAMYVAAGLSRTRVQKVARVQSQSADVEAKAQRNIQKITSSQLLPFEFRIFTNRAEAIDWLSGAFR